MTVRLVSVRPTDLANGFLDDLKDELEEGEDVILFLGGCSDMLRHYLVSDDEELEHPVDAGKLIATLLNEHLPGKPAVGREVTCTVCGRVKKPVGRDAPPGPCLCSHGCEGYYEDPRPGTLWPGEVSQ